MADLPDDAQVDAEYQYDIADDTVTRAAATGNARRALARRRSELERETANAVHELTAKGYSVRDAAALLEMTPGRVSTLS